jgi:hypothetical protein
MKTTDAAAKTDARVAYRLTARRARKLLAAISEQLETHAEVQQDSPHDWGHVGDLTHLCGSLETVADWFVPQAD